MHAGHHGSRGGAVDTIVGEEAEACSAAVEVGAVFKQGMAAAGGVGAIDPGRPGNGAGGTEIDRGNADVLIHSIGRHRIAHPAANPADSVEQSGVVTVS